ncbi:MAG: RNA polymerase sigma factor [Steroidobacteraceae bacterium]
MDERVTESLEVLRRELVAYLCRLVIRPEIAEELAQTTLLRGLEAALPDSLDGQRAWFFTVATNLAIDERRRHSHWREVSLDDLRTRAEQTPDILERSQQLRGTPETIAIAREHLVACLACTMRSLPEPMAAALLLKEVHGFSSQEVADMLGIGVIQVKNHLQEARRRLQRRYGERCALIGQQGVCHQCEELDGYFDAHQGRPLSQRGGIEDRLAILRARSDQAWGPWHRLIFGLLDELS